MGKLWMLNEVLLVDKYWPNDLHSGRRIEIFGQILDEIFSYWIKREGKWIGLDERFAYSNKYLHIEWSVLIKDVDWTKDAY